jgi:hypothetical protein
MALQTVNDVKLLTLPRHVDHGGELVVFEERSGLPFPVRRFFSVAVSQKAVRGRHAHRMCAQAFLCPRGAIEVECDDGRAKHTFSLDRPDLALVIPASIWATESYQTADSMLLVLCDRPYDEADYIRNYSAFLAWRQEASAP